MFTGRIIALYRHDSITVALFSDFLTQSVYEIQFFGSISELSRSCTSYYNSNSGMHVHFTQEKLAHFVHIPESLLFMCWKTLKHNWNFVNESTCWKWWYVLCLQQHGSRWNWIILMVTLTWSCICIVQWNRNWMFRKLITDHICLVLSCLLACFYLYKFLPIWGFNYYPKNKYVVSNFVDKCAWKTFTLGVNILTSMYIFVSLWIQNVL